MVMPNPSTFQQEVETLQVASEITIPPNAKALALEIMRDNALNPNRARIGPGDSSQPIKARGLYVGMDIIAISDALTARMGRKIDLHNVTHILFDLQKRGLITFGTSKNPGKAGSRGYTGGQGGRGGGTPQNIPVRIMLTKKALMPSEPDMQAPVSDTNPRGNPFLEPELKVELVTADVIDEGRTPTNGHAMVHDVEVEGGTAVVDALERVTALVPDLPQPSPDRQSGPAVPAFSIASYPAVERLYRSEQKIRQAAVLLRQAGQPQLAEMAEEALGERSAVEFETIQLLQHLAQSGLINFEEEEQ